MATTTNYSWATPDDTDLVKDGASAIRTLGSAIDATTKNLNPQTTTGALAYRSATANVNTALPIGTAGQVLRVNSGATAPEWAATDAGGLTKISVTSFTSVSAISLANDSFTTTYNNYLALIKITGSSSSGFLAAKLRLSGTDATGSDYYYYGDARNAQSGSIAVSAASTNVGLFFGYYQSTSGLLPNVHKIEIYNPKLAERTSLIGHSASSNNDVINQMAWVNVMGFHSVATAYDSMSIVASAGNISGTITLYGYEV